MTRRYRIGEVIEGRVSGIQNYGVFVQLDDNTQGLIHISECRHGYVSSLDDTIKINQMVKVKIIDIDEFSHKISLSLRALKKMNTPPFPARNKKYPKRYLPRIGFKTLGKQMPKLIQEGLEVIATDQFHHIESNNQKNT